MFEKEAEEYFRENAYNFDEVTACRECMEFGFNKTNEWHYVKDGLPKDGVQVLSEKGHLVIYKGDCFCWFEYSPNADNIKLRKWEEPIAWKEIVLPKENE